MEEENLKLPRPSRSARPWVQRWTGWKTLSLVALTALLASSTSYLAWSQQLDAWLDTIGVGHVGPVDANAQDGDGSATSPRTLKYHLTVAAAWRNPGK